MQNIGLTAAKKVAVRVNVRRRIFRPGFSVLAAMPGLVE